jgi:hypothetical protein
MLVGDKADERRLSACRIGPMYSPCWVGLATPSWMACAPSSLAAARTIEELQSLIFPGHKEQAGAAVG